MIKDQKQKNLRIDVSFLFVSSDCVENVLIPGGHLEALRATLALDERNENEISRLQENCRPRG